MKRLIPPDPNSGRTVIVKTIIPIPPIHWVVDLQMRIDSFMDSILVKIEEPVVVNPEIVSKRISIYLSSIFDRT